jgi:hypothetical protein
MFIKDCLVLFVLFVVLSLPQTYTLVNDLFSKVGLTGIIKSAGQVQVSGIAIHGLVFLGLYCCLYKKFGGDVVSTVTLGLLPAEKKEEFYY